MLPPFPEELSEEAKQSLLRLGVKVMTETRVTNITRDGVTVKHGENVSTIKTKTVLWAAGVGPTKLTRALAQLE